MLFLFLLLLFGFWLIMLPFRILFRMLFGIGGILLRVLLAPLMLLVFGVVIVALTIAAVVAVLAPFIPIAILAFAAWAIYRLVARRSVPAI